MVPSPNRALPLIRDFRQEVDSRPHVLAALGVVGRGCRQTMRPLLKPLRIASMKSLQRQPEGGRVAADLTERS